jgi:hypothetical protein
LQGEEEEDIKAFEKIKEIRSARQGFPRHDFGTLNYGYVS